jgi:hypothetical protein
MKNQPQVWFKRTEFNAAKFVIVKYFYSDIIHIAGQFVINEFLNIIRSLLPLILCC